MEFQHVIIDEIILPSHTNFEDDEHFNIKLLLGKPMGCNRKKENRIKHTGCFPEINVENELHMKYYNEEMK